MPEKEGVFMNATQRKSRMMLITSMCIFGTIGILRRHIPLSSSVVALVRGIIGSLFLLSVIFLSKRKLDTAAIRKNIGFLALSGAAIGFNWILLFEAYNYTSVATATLCYYLAPILVILASPVVLKEKLTPRKIFCTMTALAGMVLVSGVTETGFGGISELKGIFLGIGAAVLYASVVLMNKRFPGVPAYEKTILQLSMAAAALIPYVLLTEDVATLSLTPLAAVLLLIAGIVHTGIAYWLYFGCMNDLPSHTVALMSYIDPILAIVLSLVLLREPMSAAAGVGAVLILGAAYLSEK